MDTQLARKSILQKLQQSAQPVPLEQKQWHGQLSDKSCDELCALFTRVLTAHNCTVINLETITDLPAAVNDYLREKIANPLIFGGDNPLLNTLAWSSVGLQWQETEFTDDGQTSIATADYGIADTGTVVVLSSEKNPTRNNFLAEHHLVVIKKETILPYSEDVWRSLLQQHNNQLPRAINFISGPSSSADVGLKLEYGAHGPRSLAVFIVG